MDHWRRSLLKAVSYRVGGLVATFAIAWLVTGRADVATVIGAGDTLLKIGLYYLHERVWLRIHYGRRKAGEYET